MRRGQNRTTKTTLRSQQRSTFKKGFDRADIVRDVRYPAPTIAIRGTLGSSDGCVEVFCTDDSISGNRIDPIFSSCRRPSLGPASCKFFFSTGGREPLQSSDLVTTKLREVSLFPPCGVRATSRSHELHSHPSISRLH